MEPPVSDALILTMAKLFTIRELSHIMLLHSGTPLAAGRKAKTLFEHMQSKEALKHSEANTPLRRIRAGREGSGGHSTGRGAFRGSLASREK